VLLAGDDDGADDGTAEMALVATSAAYEQPRDPPDDVRPMNVASMNTNKPEMKSAAFCREFITRAAPALNPGALRALALIVLIVEMSGCRATLLGSPQRVKVAAERPFHPPEGEVCR
jgi:hypothetical protein